MNRLVKDQEERKYKKVILTAIQHRKEDGRGGKSRKAGSQ
jgi:hypothetical protein